MSMIDIKSRCSKCGLVQEISTNSWCYGSPIVTCKTCGKEYLVKKLHEPAIEGTVSAFVSFKAELWNLLKSIGLGVVGWILYEFTGRNFFSLGFVLVLAGVIGVILYGGGIIKLAAGGAKTENEQYMRESQDRLYNRDYVKKFAVFGYDVPDNILEQVNLTREEIQEEIQQDNDNPEK